MQPLLLPSRFSSLRKRVALLKPNTASSGRRRTKIISEDIRNGPVYAAFSTKEKELFRNLSNPSLEEVLSSIQKLGDSKNHRLLPLFWAMLKDPNPRIRVEGMMAAGYLGKPKDLPRLGKMLYDKSPLVQHYAIELFGVIASEHKQALPFLLNRASKGMDLQITKSMKRALSISKYFPPEYEIYAGAERNSKFIDPTKNIARRWQLKDGSSSVLLGGRLFKKARIVTIDKKALNAWELAQKSGIPVEPILEKGGKLRVRKNPDGFYNVSAGIIDGQSLFTFIRAKGSRKWLAELRKQIGAIKDKLTEIGVAHGHEHSGNYVVKMENGKPKVYLIDFDAAQIKKSEMQIPPELDS
ncbi:MAG: HEAT repeat domain-containing protein [archaeon]|jgi:hypothetical protein